jgi:acyl-CoA reductase-like NAD-dependent aldehyde dehydrogenase
MSGGGPPIEVRFPYTGERVSWLSGVSRQTMDDAIAGALAAFEEYKTVPPHRRASLLRAVAEILDDRTDELAQAITLESGKAIRDSRVECKQAVSTFRVAAEEATRIEGETVPLDGVETDGMLGDVRRFPMGPVAAITPFCSPLGLVAHKVAPALAAGNSVLVKPSPETPLSALSVGRAVLDAASALDLPAGLISVLPCADDAAEPLVTDPRVRVLSFTGSSRVGWELRSLAGQKRVTLELSGNCAVIVHKDGEIERAAERCAQGAFLLAGQHCASVQRIYAHESIADALIRLLVTHAQRVTSGDPRDDETQVGPMRSEDEAKRAAEWLDEAVAAGAQVLCGGRHDGPVFQPTVVTGTRHHLRIVCEEVFAPIVVVERYSELDEAIIAANSTEFGLQASIFSNDLNAVYQAHRELDVGAVVVNDVFSARLDGLPVEGAKSSGLGSSGVRHAIREQTEPRLLVLNPNTYTDATEGPRGPHAL